MKKYFLYVLQGSLFVVIIAALYSFLHNNPGNALSFNDPGKWEKLGEQKVDFRLDNDVILVSDNDNRCVAIKLRVTKGEINLFRCVIHYKNGETSLVQLRNSIEEGGESRVIDLSHKESVISKVVFWYDTKTNAQNRALVELWGKS
jgi:Protein of unknown function (DUF2541)